MDYQIKQTELEVQILANISKFKDFMLYIKEHAVLMHNAGSCLSPTLFSLFFSDITKIIPNDIQIALFADDLCIWYSNRSLRLIEQKLNHTIHCIQTFCSQWGLRINTNKTLQSVFTTAGHRANYESKYKLKLQIDNQPIPLEPFPIFLGIQFDPKLCFKNLFENINTKVSSKINLIRRIKDDV
ncbi:AP-like endonuclease reverse transcriptase [Brachionus plicatilis]|uniref:AP-like endonuclease reverse transcriptase n=1 Tax=Brachionus plicatilis TaxID=10195 RepID=A0A3M7SUD1_BRAPC|nr:AP-like endonuclease reverse transcriptase [Brachionus plicatilis]